MCVEEFPKISPTQLEELRKSYRNNVSDSTINQSLGLSDSCENSTKKQDKHMPDYNNSVLTKVGKTSQCTENQECVDKNKIPTDVISDKEVFTRDSGLTYIGNDFLKRYGICQEKQENENKGIMQKQNIEYQTYLKVTAVANENIEQKHDVHARALAKAHENDYENIEQKYDVHARALVKTHKNDNENTDMINNAYLSKHENESEITQRNINIAGLINNSCNIARENFEGLINNSDEFDSKTNKSAAEVSDGLIDNLEEELSEAKTSDLKPSDKLINSFEDKVSNTGKAESENFEDTDALIEKTVNFSFDLMRSNTIDSLFDLAKFHIQH